MYFCQMGLPHLSSPILDPAFPGNLPKRLYLTSYVTKSKRFPYVGAMWTPRDIKRHCDNEKFDKFIGLPFYSFSSERHRKSEVNDYLQSLEVEGKVSVLMGLAAASAKYGHHEETSSKQEVISLSSSVFARKGFLSPSKETVLCSDKGMSFYVDSIEIGMEEILIVSMAHER